MIQDDDIEQEMLDKSLCFVCHRQIVDGNCPVCDDPETYKDRAMTLEQTEKERQAFEAWYAQVHLPTPMYGRTFERRGEAYRLQEVEDAFFTWLARAKAAKSEIDYAYTTGFQEGRPVWISVEDRLPELDAPVHALLDGHVGIFARCDDDNGSWLWARCYGTSSWDNYGDWLQDDDYQSITHWQPLPTPPKAE